MLQIHRHLAPAVALQTSLKRLQELYRWGHISKEEYLTDYEESQHELEKLSPVEDKNKLLERLAQFLANVTDAWDEASQEQRNKLARCLFQEVWIKDREVVAVKPQPEIKPFFDLNYEAMEEKLSQNFGKWRPRGDLNRHVQYIAYLLEVVCPYQMPIISRCKLSPDLWPKLAGRHRTQSLRGLAKEYGVSHESVRRALLEKLRVSTQRGKWDVEAIS